jgi:hypothetical protein
MHHTYVKSSYTGTVRRRFQDTFQNVRVPNKITTHTIKNKRRYYWTKKGPIQNAECSLRRNGIKSVTGLNILSKNPTTGDLAQKCQHKLS